MSFSEKIKQEISAGYNNSKHCILARQKYKELFANKIDSISDRIYKRECCKREIIKQAFILSGSMNDPSNSYHFEIIINNEKEFDLLSEIFAYFDIIPLSTVRKNKYILYFKDSEIITEVLGLIGANKAILELANVKVIKQVKANVNRQVNCETSNIHKIISSSSNQIEDINLVNDKLGLDNINSKLKEVAKLRLKFPDDSLEELGRKCNPVISKSSIYYRMRRINKLALEIRNGEK